MRVISCAIAVLAVAAYVKAGAQDSTTRRVPAGVARATRPDTSTMQAPRGAGTAGTPLQADLVVKTFKLAHIRPNDADALIRLYAPAGPVSVANVAGLQLLTVRAPAASMAQVEKVLAQYDHAPASVSLAFELVSADTSAARDPAVVGLDSVLRGVLRFTGYKLVGRALGNVNEGSTFAGTIGSGPLRLTAQVERVNDEGSRHSVDLNVRLVQDVMAPTAAQMKEEVMTSAEITVPLGEMVVLGTAANGAAGALILAVRPQLIAPLR